MEGLNEPFLGLLPNAVLILSCRAQRRERRTNVKVEDPSSSSLNQEGDKHVSVHHSASVMAVCLVTRSCPAPCDPVDGSSSDSSVCEISQTRILVCVAIPPPGESSDQGSNPCLLHLLQSLHHCAPWGAHDGSSAVILCSGQDIAQEICTNLVSHVQLS